MVFRRAYSKPSTWSAVVLHEIGHVFCDPDKEPRTALTKLDSDLNAWRWLQKPVDDDRVAVQLVIGGPLRMSELPPKAVGDEILGDVVHGERFYHEEPFDLGFNFSVGDSDKL
jgi:hypothetical protein